LPGIRQGTQGAARGGGHTKPGKAGMGPECRGREKTRSGKRGGKEGLHSRPNRGLKQTKMQDARTMTRKGGGKEDQGKRPSNQAKELRKTKRKKKTREKEKIETRFDKRGIGWGQGKKPKRGRGLKKGHTFSSRARWQGTATGKKGETKVFHSTERGGGVKVIREHSPENGSKKKR